MATNQEAVEDAVAVSRRAVALVLGPTQGEVSEGWNHSVNVNLTPEQAHRIAALLRRP